MNSAGLVLRLARGDRAPEAREAGDGPVSIGSWSGATVPLDDASMLPVHVVLDPEGDGRWRLVSLAPAGVEVNGRSIRRGFVSSGDRLRIGSYELVLEATGFAAQPPREGEERPLKAVMRWKGAPLDARVMAPGEVLTVGESRAATFHLPLEAKGSKDAWAAAACIDGVWHVALDAPLRATELNGRPILTTAARTDGPKLPKKFQAGRLWAPIPAGAPVRLESGELEIELKRSLTYSLEKRVLPPWWTTNDGQRTLIALMVLLFLVGVLRNPPPGTFAGDEDLQQRKDLVAQFQAPPISPEMQQQLEKWKKKFEKDAKQKKEEQAAKAQGQEGVAGKPDAPKRQAKSGGPKSAADVVKQHALLQALSSGATEKLLSGGALSAANSLGHLDGPAVGDANGTLGLGLKGTGTGGGGLSADSVGVGPVGSKAGFSGATGAGKLAKGGQSDLGIDEPASVQGGLDREVIRRVIMSHRAQIRYCYEKQLSATPNLAGKVLVEFVIGADGQVTTARPSEDTLSDPEVGRCIVSKVRTWTFPQPKGGGVVVVTYPFLFKPAGQGG